MVLVISFLFLADTFADDVYVNMISSELLLMSGADKSNTITCSKSCRDECQAHNGRCEDNCTIDNRKCQEACGMTRTALIPAVKRIVVAKIAVIPNFKNASKLVIRPR